MAGFITSMVANTVQNAAAGFLASGVATIGTYAGDAVSGVGNLIENAGTGVGNGIAGKFDGWGNAIKSYGDGVQRATAPNSSSVSSRAVVPANKSGGKKTAASKTVAKTAGPYAPYAPGGTRMEQKQLPATSAQKRLTAASVPTKKVSSVAGGPAARAGGPAALPNLPSARDAAGKVRMSKASMPKPNGGYKPPASGPIAKTEQSIKTGQNKSTPSYTAPSKSASGKTVIRKESQPGAKPYKPPTTGGQKYEGPLNLSSGIGSPVPKQPGTSGSKPYEGALSLSSTMDSSKLKQPTASAAMRTAPKPNGPQPAGPEPTPKYNFF